VKRKIKPVVGPAEMPHYNSPAPDVPWMPKGYYKHARRGSFTGPDGKLPPQYKRELGYGKAPKRRRSGPAENI
jgi:hypothetical protein